VSDTDVLDYLKAPTLEKLGFEFADEDTEFVLAPLESLCDRVGCNLRRLTFKGVLAASAVAQLLQDNPSVTELVIIVYSEPNHLFRAWKATNDLISHLTNDNSTRPMLYSQLSGIHLGCQNGTYFDHSHYLEMLQSRWNTKDRRLMAASLAMHEGPGPDAPTPNGLYALRKDGLGFLLAQDLKAVDVIDDWTYAPSWTRR
jgi:hypothetical protein